MPLEAPDYQHWQAAVGYVELGMFQEAMIKSKTLIRLTVLRLKFSRPGFPSSFDDSQAYAHPSGVVLQNPTHVQSLDLDREG